MSGYLPTSARLSATTITFTGPHGSFFLRETDRPVLLLAGGTGLAPILAMLRKMRADGSQRKAHLIYGVSTDATWWSSINCPRSLAADRIQLGALRFRSRHHGRRTRAG